MILSDIERLSKILNDMKCRTVSLQQLSFLFQIANWGTTYCSSVRQTDLHSHCIHHRCTKLEYNDLSCDTGTGRHDTLYTIAKHTDKSDIVS